MLLAAVECYVLFAVLWWMGACWCGYGKLALYDIWVGLYYDSSKHRLYMCLLPCCVMWIE